MEHGLGLRLGPAEGRTQAREQLVHPERLRDVVVGTRIERGHLFGLVPDDREDQHGRIAPPA